MLTLSTVVAFLALGFMPEKKVEVGPPSVKPDPRSIDGLIAFLESKPADKEYRWSSPATCALGQWGSAVGRSACYVRLLESAGVKDTIDFELHTASRLPHTFGAMLERTKKYKAEHSL